MKKWILIILAGVLLVLWLYPAASCFAKAQPTDHLSRDLKKVLANQARIMTALSEIKEELKIVKIRATLR